ncbi:MAG: MerR family transcriptional regulator [Kurthia sp.]|nr:MerR family transcriptional regulator [Kurthia sp.]
MEREKLKGFFTTGEFARLCNVRKQTLFHYDEIGLLKPEVKLDNGYRYYSYQQFDVFSVIELLKELNMPLKEIKQFLATKSPEQFVTLFEEKKRELQQKMKHLKQLERIVDTKLAITKEGMATDFTTIRIQPEEEERFFISADVKNTDDKAFLHAISDLIEFVYNEELDIGYPIGAILQREEIENEDYENYVNLYTKIAPTKRQVPIHVKEKGFYVVAYHIGEESKKYTTYERIQQYVRDQQMRLASDAYEEYVFEETAVSELENYVTEIKIRVE